MVLAAWVVALGGCAAVDDARTTLLGSKYVQSGDRKCGTLPLDRRAALNAYDRAMALRPGDDELKGRLLGRYAELEAWDRAWACLSAARQFGRAAQVTRGQILLNTGREEDGAAALFQLLGQRPRSAPVPAELANAVGYLLADAGVHLPEALRLTEVALQQTPGDPAVMDSVGWAHFRLGEYERAAFHLERALRHMEGTPAPPAFLVLVAWFGSESEAYAKTLPVIEYHLGCAYARQGYVAKARGALRSSLEHDPQYGPAQQELSRLQYQLQGGVRASAAEPGRQS